MQPEIKYTTKSIDYIQQVSLSHIYQVTFANYYSSIQLMPYVTFYRFTDEHIVFGLLPLT